ADEHRGEPHEQEVAGLDVDGEVVDVEDLGGDTDTEALRGEGEKVAEPEAQERAQRADEEAFEDERVENDPCRGPDGAEDGDLAGLLLDQEDEGAEHRES